MARLTVKVVPRASRTRVVGWLGDALKVAVTAPPEGGRANAAVEEVLAAWLDVPVGTVRCIAGHGASRKIFDVSGVTDQALRDKIAVLAQQRNASPPE